MNKHSKTEAVSRKEDSFTKRMLLLWVSGWLHHCFLMTTSGTACNIVDAKDDMVEGIYAMAESFELEPTERPYAG